MTVWDALVGQRDAVDRLKRAVVDAGLAEPGPEMTHAWLITGPPGSGRSMAAVAFATALVCPDGGCGVCDQCREVASGVHSDVTIVRPSGVILGVDQTRGLVGRVGVLPIRSEWNVIVIEDADRLNEHADNALLKALEEPPPRGVWILCAPSADDLLPTIRSRCRVVRLRTPPIDDVADYLTQAEGVDPALAAYAARAAQGHVGRARALATDPEERVRHQEILRFPSRLGSVAACLTAADDVVAAAKDRVAAVADPMDAAELAELLRNYGEGGTGPGTARSRASSVIKDQEKEHRNRRRRLLRDELDRVLLDLLGLYRDVLAVTTLARTPLINEELRSEIDRLAAATDAPGALRRIDAIGRARALLAADGTEELVFERLALELQRPPASR